MLPGAAAGAAGEERSMAASSDMSMKVANVRYELADGVTTDKKTGAAYQFGDTNEAAVEKVAKAFGVEGAVRDEENAWSVGGNDKSEADRSDGTYLYVSRSGGVFSMSRNYEGSGTSGCSVEPAAPDAPVSSDMDVARCEPTTTTVPPNAPTAEGAKKVAVAALKAAGVDVDDAKVTTESYDPAVQNVRVQLTVAGATVDGYESYVAVGPENKIISASGYLVDPANVGDYDLASLERAVERLNESFGQATTLEARDDAAVSSVAGDDAAVSSGAPEPLVDPAVEQEPTDPGEPTVVTLTKVSVGLMMQSDYDGDLWLVPAYLFTSSDGNPVVTQAADDKYIEKPPATEPTPEPGATDPGQTAPGSAANCAPIEGDITGNVCTDAESYQAGDTVTFRVTATDEDRAFTSGCFDGVEANYGDDSGGDVRCEACSTDVPAGPGKLGVDKTHTYEKAGTYTATFTIKSGADCGPSDPKDSTGKATLKIRVA